MQASDHIMTEFKRLAARGCPMRPRRIHILQSTPHYVGEEGQQDDHMGAMITPRSPYPSAAAVSGAAAVG